MSHEKRIKEMMKSLKRGSRNLKIVKSNSDVGWDYAHENNITDKAIRAKGICTSAELKWPGWRSKKRTVGLPGQIR